MDSQTNKQATIDELEKAIALVESHGYRVVDEEDMLAHYIRQTRIAMSTISLPEGATFKLLDKKDEQK